MQASASTNTDAAIAELTAHMRRERIRTKLLTGMGYVSVCMLLGPGILLWYGYALSVLWGWFAVPLGAPVIGTVHAAGLIVLSGAMAIRRWRPSTPDREKAMEGAAIVVAPALTIAVGWLIHQCM